MPEQIMYVSFEKDTGRILSISNERDDNANIIEVPLSEVKTLIEGKEPFSNYAVEYNAKTKTLEFANRFEHVFDHFSVNDFIYELPEEDIKDPDILLIQDVPNTCWKVQIGKDLKQNLRSRGVSLNTGMMFSITSKADPNVLYKTLSVHFGTVVNDNYCIIPFSMPFETEQESISVYTSRRFDTYQFKRIFDEQ
jgi:hypothetical protein